MKAILEKVLVLAESFGGDFTPVEESIGIGPGLYIIFLIISNLLSPGASFAIEAVSAFFIIVSLRQKCSSVWLLIVYTNI